MKTSHATPCSLTIAHKHMLMDKIRAHYCHRVLDKPPYMVPRHPLWWTLASMLDHALQPATKIMTWRGNGQVTNAAVAACLQILQPLHVFRCVRDTTFYVFASSEHALLTIALEHEQGIISCKQHETHCDFVQRLELDELQAWWASCERGLI